jgi:hypothetical protein
MAAEYQAIARFEECQKRMEDLEAELNAKRKLVPANFHRVISIEMIRDAENIDAINDLASQLRAINVRVNALLAACKLEERLREYANNLDDSDKDLTLIMKTRARERREESKKGMKEYVEKKKKRAGTPGPSNAVEQLPNQAGSMQLQDKDQD